MTVCEMLTDNRPKSQHADAQHEDAQHEDTQHDDIQHEDTRMRTLSIMDLILQHSA
jgi:hypothetical protein